MILSRAPLRITLGGGGTDLPSYYSRCGGFILATAINKYVYICLNRPSADELIRVKYSQYEQVERVDEIRHDLVKPALQMLDINRAIEIVSLADVPDGTGLGSSGSYLVALLSALHEFKREKVPIQALAEQAVHIEADIAGHPVGKQDHYLAAFGGITCLDIGQDGKVQVSPLDISISAVEYLHTSTLLFFTGIIRKSGDILSSQKTDTESGVPEILDSLNRTKELGYRIKEALQRENMHEVGLLMDEHWQNKKKRSEKMTETRIDKWYETAKENGALGGKIIGAGGGGFLMLFCENDKRGKVRKAMAEEGLKEMHYQFEYEGAKVIANF